MHSIELYTFLSMELIVLFLSGGKCCVVAGNVIQATTTTTKKPQIVQANNTFIKKSLQKLTYVFVVEYE